MSEPGHADEAAGDLLLGVDIGGTKILAGLVDPGGRVIERWRCHTRPQHILADTMAACRALVERAGRLGRPLVGIGVGAKGAVDMQRRRLVASLYLGHGEIPIGDELERAFGLPVRVENDVHAATIGERIFGVGRRVDDFVFYNAGTGISVGIVAAGELYRGASNTAGENGHAMVDGSGSWPCPCGMSGCVETMIIAGRRGAALPPVDWPAIDGRPEDPAYGYLLSNLLDVATIFAPVAIVFAGGMLAANPRAVAWLAEAFASSRAEAGACATIEIVHAFAGQDAGLVGAAALLLAPRATWRPVEAVEC